MGSASTYGKAKRWRSSVSQAAENPLGRIIVNLAEPTDGNVLFRGESIFGREISAQQSLRQKTQIIFQDPYASLNPRKTIGKNLGQALAVHEGGRAEDYRNEVLDMLDRVGLRRDNQMVDRYPHEFSGRQRQRIAIARALILRPEFVVADEAVSSLDVSIRAQILALLTEIQRDMNLTYLFITHDLGVVRSMAQRVAVMLRGRIVEEGPVDDVFNNPT